VLDRISARLIALALEEDLGPGDATSMLVPADVRGRAYVLAKSPLVLSGSDAFSEVFAQVSGAVDLSWEIADGEKVHAGTVRARVNGPARDLLVGERTALNLLQRLSGIATMARRAADAVAGTKAKVVDTRKTTPGMRALEKAAVRAGGAFNHRFGLFDGVLIKDNHVRAAGGVRAAIEAAKATVHHLMKIECEVSSIAEADEALAAGADVIMLDNMDLDSMRKAVERIAGRALVEASGNVTLERLPAIAATGVDLISMGALTHSAPAADISMKWEVAAS
jgi:nicotinate-nucleotide pyrophosphorylase (carboxylating)